MSGNRQSKVAKLMASNEEGLTKSGEAGFAEGQARVAKQARSEVASR